MPNAHTSPIAWSSPVPQGKSRLRPANACPILPAQAAGRHIETVESLAARGRLHPIQEAFARHGAIQCGFCAPGLLMSAKAVLDRVSDPTPAQVRTAIPGNLCRCTGYTKIVEAILAAARTTRPEAPPHHRTSPRGI